MAADLFESYSVMLVAALILGQVAFGNDGLFFPLIVTGIGVITAVIGIFAVPRRSGDHTGMSTINRGFFISAVVSAIGVAIAPFTFVSGIASGVESSVYSTLLIGGAVFGAYPLATGNATVGVIVSMTRSAR